MPNSEACKDIIVEQVRDKLKRRSEAGILKYGTMLTRSDLNLRDWVQHIQEELLDAANYAECILSKSVVYQIRNAKGWEDVSEHDYKFTAEVCPNEARMVIIIG